MLSFIQLTETDKRVIFAIFLLLILVFVLIGYIGLLITRIMKKQGSKIDTKVYDVVTTRVITNKKQFKSYARKKNLRMFYKSAQIPLIIIVIAAICVLIHHCINGFDVSLFDARHGFSTILFIWDFNDPEIMQTFFGIKLLAKWPSLMEEIGKPQFRWEAFTSYLAVFGGFVGIAWYLFTVQGYIARFLRINKLCDSIFEKSLDGFNQNNQAFAQNNIPQNNTNADNQNPPSGNSNLSI